MTYVQVRAELQKTPRHWCVTGAAGFIGSHLVEELLQAGQRVTALDNLATGYRRNIEDVLRRVGGGAAERFVFIEGDITDLTACARACSGADYVLHQAALGSVPRSIENPLASHGANVDGFINMLQSARECAVKRFIYASSSSVYGDEPTLPKREAALGNALSPYAATKRINEIYADVFSEVYGQETVGLRYFNVFGPRQDPNGAYAAVIPRWIAKLMAGETCEVYGDGETSRDFCYVANVVQANILAAVTPGESREGRIYNVAAAAKTSLLELYAMITERLQGFTGVAYPPRPLLRDFRAGDVRHSLADISRIERRLDYKAAVTVAQGMRETVAWFAEQNK